MNKTELQMVECLRELREKYAVVGVKAEFEAEGTRTEELMRLKEVCLSIGLPLTLKIGGCEGLRDIYNARVIGVNHLLAPMIESPYALQKYLRLIDKAIPQDEQQEIEFLINVETIQAVKCFDDMLNIPEIGKLNGIVIGRSDLTGSMGYSDKTAVDSEEIFIIVRDVLTKAKRRGMTCVVGGKMTGNSIPFLKNLPGLLDRFETRKVCFAAPAAFETDIIEGINKALYFEMLWLQNKRNYYKEISEEDNQRISALESRFCRQG